MFINSNTYDKSLKKKVYCLFLIFRNKNNKTLILLHFTKKTILSYIQKPQKQQLKFGNVLPINMISFGVFASYSAMSVALVTQEKYYIKLLLHVDIVGCMIQWILVFFFLCFISYAPINYLLFKIYLPNHWFVLLNQ